MKGGREAAFYNSLSDLILADGETAYAIGKSVRNAADDRIVSVPELEQSTGMRIVQRRDGIDMQIMCSFAKTRTTLQEALLDSAGDAARSADALVGFLAHDVPDPAAAYKTLCDRFAPLQGLGFIREEGPPALAHLKSIKAYPITPSGFLAPSQEVVHALDGGVWRVTYRRQNLYLEFILDYRHTDLQVTVGLSKSPNGLRLRLVEN